MKCGLRYKLRQFKKYFFEYLRGILYYYIFSGVFHCKISHQTSLTFEVCENLSDIISWNLE